MVLNGPVDGVDHRVGRPAAAEDLERVELGIRRDSRPDQELLRRQGLGVVGTAVRLAVRRHAVPADRARHVRPVPGAVERVRVGVRDNGVARSTGVVRVAHEVEPARHLRVGEPAPRESDAVVRGVGRRVAQAAEVGVGVVDAGVDDGDLHTIPGEARAG